LPRFAALPPKSCRPKLPNFPGARVIRLRLEGYTAMIRSLGAGAGFEDRPRPAASPRLIHAVAASLAVGSLSLCLIVALTVLSIKISSAAPLPL
jgi:hypothetical protein